MVYKCEMTDGSELTVNSPGDLPEATKRNNISEPYVRLEMVTPAEYVGNLMELANGRRGEFVEMKYLTGMKRIHIRMVCVSQGITGQSIDRCVLLSQSVWFCDASAVRGKSAVCLLYIR